MEWNRNTGDCFLGRNFLALCMCCCQLRKVGEQSLCHLVNCIGVKLCVYSQSCLDCQCWCVLVSSLVGSARDCGECILIVFRHNLVCFGAGNRNKLESCCECKLLESCVRNTCSDEASVQGSVLDTV